MSVNDVELAIALAAMGASVVRECFGSKLQRFEKGGGDFATNADVAAENAMLELLRRHRPDDAILAEESGSSGVKGGRVWLIDPLCGTLNYAAKMRLVAVNVALKTDDRFTAAAVADAFSDDLFWTDGASSFVRTGTIDKRLAPDTKSRLVDLNVDPPFPNAPAFKAAMLATDPDFCSMFRARVVSTSLALTWVASGQRAGYVTDGDLRDSVHAAAGLAICESAGCTLTDLHGQSWGKAATGLIAAADAEAHARLLMLIRKQLG
jgi:myo-inositol-1(or 4)-monophosphatase